MGEGLLRQVYRCIYASKHEGISMKDISRMLGTEFSTIKLAIKYLLLHDLLHVSVFDYRRQRTSR